MDRRNWIATAMGAIGAIGLALPARAALNKPWPRQAPTPRIELPALDGTAWSLADQKGHPVLLNFWASWCEPCRTEMPSLGQLADRHRDAGLRVFAVNYREVEATVRRFQALVPAGMPIVRDAQGAAARAFGVRIFPSTVAVDRSGRTLFTLVGEADWMDASVAKVVQRLL